MIKMKDKHIDDMTMSLYLGGGSNLRKDLVKWVQSHLEECEPCAKNLETKLNEMTDQQKLKDSEKPDLELNVLNRVTALLSLPLKSPSCWGKLKELCNQLIDTLSEFEALHLQSKSKRGLSLLTTGYMYTPSSAKEEDTKNIQKESQEKQQIGEKILSLLEILGDDEVPISKRIALLEELLLYAKQKAKELKGRSSSTQNLELDKGKDNNLT